MKRCIALLQIALLTAWCGTALAQDKGTVDPQPLPPLANPNDPKLPARELFGRKLTPANLQGLRVMPEAFDEHAPVCEAAPGHDHSHHGRAHHHAEHDR